MQIKVHSSKSSFIFSVMTKLPGDELKDSPFGILFVCLTGMWGREWSWGGGGVELKDCPF